MASTRIIHLAFGLTAMINSAFEKVHKVCMQTDNKQTEKLV